MSDDKFLPRKQAMKLARRVLTKARTRGLSSYIQFQFRCEFCKVECTVAERDRLPRVAQCFRCGRVQKIEKASSIIFEKKEGADRYGLVLQEGVEIPSSYTRLDSGSGAGSSDPAWTERRVPRYNDGDPGQGGL